MPSEIERSFCPHGIPAEKACKRCYDQEQAAKRMGAFLQEKTAEFYEQNKNIEQKLIADLQQQVAQLQATISQLTKALKNARQLGSIGYRIGEADMRGHDKIGERYAKQQAAIESEIDTALVHAQEKP